MMNRDEETILAEALRWHAQSESDDMDWDGFTAWLEADDRHRDAYDTVALGEALLDDHRHSLREAFPEASAPANDDGPASPTRLTYRASWLRWTGTAAAASLLALVAGWQLMPARSLTYETQETSRTIALNDGSSVILAPRSVLEISGRNQQHMALTGGAWFDIRHNPSRALAIEAGGMEITDIGTQFDVQDAENHLRVEVAEGSLEIRSPAIDRPIALTQGHRLTFNASAGTAIIQSVSEADTGEWRDGRLTFDSTPLALVAADISRYAGVKVTVAQSLRNRQFSGTLVIGNGEAALRDLTQLMGIGLRSGPDGVMLVERR
ncbi:MAG: FecR family protein [Novosphingobium sp.]